MSQPINVDSESFSKEISENTKLIVVDFYADWCGPCRQLSPVLDKAAEDYKEEIKVLKINVDQNGELAKEYQVRSIPQLFFLKEGKNVGSSKGFQSTTQLNKMIDEFLKS